MPARTREKAPRHENERQSDQDRRLHLRDELALDQVELARAEREHDEDGRIEWRRDEVRADDTDGLRNSIAYPCAENVVGRLRDGECGQARRDDSPGLAQNLVEV